MPKAKHFGNLLSNASGVSRRTKANAFTIVRGMRYCASDHADASSLLYFALSFKL